MTTSTSLGSKALTLAVALAAALHGACGDDAPPGPVSARVLDSAADGIGGPLATARAGDILIENDVARFVLERPGREFGINPYGGNVIDADLVRTDGGRDRFGELGLLINLKFTFSADEFEIGDGPDGSVEVRYRGSLALCDFLNVPFMVKEVIETSPAFETDQPPSVDASRVFRLAPGSATLEVETTLTNTGAGAQPILFAEIVDAGGQVERYLSASLPGATGAAGFENVLISTPHRVTLASSGGVSYGITPADSTGNVLANAVGVLVLARDARPEQLLGFPDGAFYNLAPGDAMTVTTWFTVGNGDVASVDGHVLGLADVDTGRIEGQAVTGPGGEPVAGARIAIGRVGLNEDYTLAMTGEDGRFVSELPPGRYRLTPYRDGYPWREGQPDQPPATEVEVTAGQVSEVSLTSLGSPGLVRYTVADAAGAAMPARLTVLGFDPAPPLPRFVSRGYDPVPYGVAHIEFSATGSGQFELEPGDWHVVVSRGLEYDLYTEPITVVAGQTTDVDAVLHRVVDTSEYVSGDFHVHAANSSDSTVLLSERITSFAAEGVEYFSLTEHEVIIDPSQLITELGLDDWIGATSGQEISTAGYGHWNAYPLPIDAGAHNGGAIAFSDGMRALTVADLYAAARSGEGDEIIQINHPRRAPVNLNWQEYFTMIDLEFGPSGPAAGPGALDPGLVRVDEAWDVPTGFDAIEVYNWANVGALVDWWNFLNFGYRVAATGNTDTHTVRLEVGGFPRTFLRVGVDEPRLVSTEDIVDAIQQSRLTVAAGAFVTARARAGGAVAGEGETLSPGADAVTVEARVQSPTWIEWDDVELYENGVLIASQVDVGASAPVVASDDGGERRDLAVSFPVAPVADAWYVVLVRSAPGRNLFPWVPYNSGEARTLEQILAGDVAGAPRPMSFTNAIWVDSDGDGEIAPSQLVIEADSVDIYADETFDRRTIISPYE